MILALVLAAQAAAAGVISRGRRSLDLLALTFLALSVIVAAADRFLP